MTRANAPSGESVAKAAPLSEQVTRLPTCPVCIGTVSCCGWADTPEGGLRLWVECCGRKDESVYTRQMMEDSLWPVTFVDLVEERLARIWCRPPRKIDTPSPR